MPVGLIELTLLASMLGHSFINELYHIEMVVSGNSCIPSVTQVLTTKKNRNLFTRIDYSPGDKRLRRNYNNAAVSRNTFFPVVVRTCVTASFQSWAHDILDTLMIDLSDLWL